MANASTRTATFNTAGVPTGFADGSSGTGASLTIDGSGTAVLNCGTATNAFGWLKAPNTGTDTLQSDAIYCDMSAVPSSGTFFGGLRAVEGGADGYFYGAYNTGTTTTLVVRRLVGGVATVVNSSPPTYDSTNHRWLRIRESGGTIFFEYTADSSGVPGTWNSLYSEAVAVNAGFDVTAVTHGCMCIRGSTDSQTIAINNYNTGVANDLTLTPTGVEVTTEVGTSAQMVTSLPAGQETTAEQGTPVAAVDVFPAGQEVTAEQTDPTLSTGGALLLTPDGQETTAEVGTSVQTATLVPAGQEATTEVGTAPANADFFPVGLDVTSQLGQAVAVMGNTTDFDAVEATAELGTPALLISGIQPVGLEVTTEQGLPVIDHPFSPAGFEVTAEFNDPVLQIIASSPPNDLTLTPAGVECSTEAGTTVEAFALAGVGQEVTAEQGTPVTNASLLPTGVHVHVELGVPATSGGVYDISTVPLKRKIAALVIGKRRGGAGGGRTE